MFRFRVHGVERIPRQGAGVIVAPHRSWLDPACVGGALAASGVVFQAILRNPLASPFTLGVSGGSALGAVVAIRLGWHGAPGGLSPLPLAALAGATP